MVQQLALIPEPPLAALALILAAALLRFWSKLHDLLHRRRQVAEGRRRCELPRAQTPPVAQDVAELQEIVRALFDGGRWDALAEVLGMLASTPSPASDGRDLYQVAVDAALSSLREAPGPAAVREMLDAYAAAAATGSPRLEALRFRALSLALRRTRAVGGGAADALARGFAEDIEDAADRSHLRASRVPCIGEALYHASTVLPGAPDRTAARLRAWIEADLANPRPYLHHAAHLGALPDSAGPLSAHLAETDAACRRFDGPATSIAARLAAAADRPLAALPGHDPEALLRWLEAIADAPGGQVLANRLAAKALADGDEALARGALYRGLRLWITDLWQDHGRFYALYARTFRGASRKRGAAVAAAPAA
ncbi:hypothetical protein OG2516_04341 [Oceanicola granulosus HTCC2516]|uniref:Uncharacterized protein n=1 Tax=Oceanicola granulosus (strain ATCC BAA-861 / DSM 15982 / KCTC 12143 / HTCC2516) TaxID=314256 RepID=Q2CA51_OCEGH|nr:hypothetical protein [Oceanicola granulosus]EAR49561.1 hypothetical protein OG2516_04341 [Oceanicola granulosus HTCC2516]